MNLQPENPPELSYTDYHRNVRNSCRQDAIDAIGQLECALEELNEESDNSPIAFNRIFHSLIGLREILELDMED
jgi:hypothetical protein